MKINRCPKCGRKPGEIRVKSISHPGVEFECYDCGFHTGRCKTRNEAIEKWNEMTKGENK